MQNLVLRQQILFFVFPFLTILKFLYLTHLRQESISKSFNSFSGYKQLKFPLVNEYFPNVSKTSSLLWVLSKTSLSTSLLNDALFLIHSPLARVGLKTRLSFWASVIRVRLRDIDDEYFWISDSCMRINPGSIINLIERSDDILLYAGLNCEDVDFRIELGRMYKLRFGEHTRWGIGDEMWPCRGELQRGDKARVGDWIRRGDKYPDFFECGVTYVE